jgi:hypothetical protein
MSSIVGIRTAPLPLVSAVMAITLGGDHPWGLDRLDRMWGRRVGHGVADISANYMHDARKEMYA